MTIGLGFTLFLSAAFDLHFLPIVAFLVGIVFLFYTGKGRGNFRSEAEHRAFLKEWVSTHALLSYGLVATIVGTFVIAFQENFSEFTVLLGYSLTHTAYLVFIIFFTLSALHGGSEYGSSKKNKKA